MTQKIADTMILLVGGRGSRLGDLTKDCPKPLLPFRGKPFLAWKCEILAQQGIKHFIFSTGYLASAFDDFEKQWLPENCTLEIITENQPLGTGGALLNVLNNSTHFKYKNLDYFWAGNGDSFWNVDLMPELQSRLENYNESEILCEMIDLCVKRVRPDQSGVLLENQHLKNWNVQNAEHINAGLYLFHKDFFNELEINDTLEKSKNSRNSKFISLEANIMPQKVETNKVLGLIDQKNLFLDFGTPEFYDKVGAILDKYFG
jgi:NDP-sugar pyrophosphorylase family protein